MWLFIYNDLKQNILHELSTFCFISNKILNFPINLEFILNYTKCSKIRSWLYLNDKSFILTCLQIVFVVFTSYLSLYFSSCAAFFLPLHCLFNQNKRIFILRFFLLFSKRGMLMASVYSSITDHFSWTGYCKYLQ